MRHTCTILLLLFLSSFGAQNNLRLYTGSGEVFTVYIADTAVNKKQEVDVLAENITDDSIAVKIVFASKLSGTKLLFLVEKGKPVKNKEFKYLVEIKNNKVRITYAGTEDILQLPSPLVPIKPVVDTSYKLRNNMLGHYCELKEGKAIYFNNIPKTGECTTAMPAVYITYFNSLAARAQIEDDKFNIAENTCMNNCISVSQLNAMLHVIPYELEKLKLVRLAYFHLTDKGKRERLDSTFKLESSKKELASFFKNINDYKLQSGISCTTASEEGKISEFCEKLAVYSNDAERFGIFKKMYVNLCYSSTQVKTVLGKFIHDREKLDAARLMYYHCTDKENFLDISDAFSYTTSVADLKDFVNKQK